MLSPSYPPSRPCETARRAVPRHCRDGSRDNFPIRNGQPPGLSPPDWKQARYRRRFWPWLGATCDQRRKTVQVNAMLPALADGKNVFFLDIGPKFLDPQGNLSKEIMPDGLHPNAGLSYLDRGRQAQTRGVDGFATCSCAQLDHQYKLTLRFIHQFEHQVRFHGEASCFRSFAHRQRLKPQPPSAECPPLA